MVLAIAAGIVGVCALTGVFAQINYAATITIDAATTYAHTDTEGVLLAPIENTETFCTRRNYVFRGWKKEYRFNNTEDETWNGLTVYYFDKPGSNGHYFNAALVGSALESGVSANLQVEAVCQDSEATGSFNFQKRTRTLRLTVTGTIPDHVAPESLYHGVRLTDGLHPDALEASEFHDFEEWYAEEACEMLDSSHWDADREHHKDTSLRPYRSIPPSQRSHCCIPAESTGTADTCFSWQPPTEEE